MNDKKKVPKKRAGRQTAKAAEQTREKILNVASKLFCQHGYNNVSLRAISEEAGVTHSLIRYHFGSKVNIWQNICDNIQSQFHTDIKALLLSLDKNMPCNKRFFQMLLTLLAKLLIDPRPIKLLIDAVKQNQELFDYFIEDSGSNHLLIQEILSQCQQDNYLTDTTVKEIKWGIIIFADAALNLSPFMEKSYPESKSKQDSLLAHWNLYAKLFAGQLGISTAEIPQPNSLNELLKETPINDIFTCPYAKIEDNNEES